MLQSEGAELADACSRLCVMRTEDYTLLRDIKQAAKAGRKTSSSAAASTGAHVLDRRYLQHVSGEFRQREAWRQDRSQRLLSRLQAWAHRYYKRDSLADAQAQLALGDAGSLYSELLVATYQLEVAADVANSPFASPDLPSCFLYDRSSVLPSTITTASVPRRDIARYIGRAQQALLGKMIPSRSTEDENDAAPEPPAATPSQRVSRVNAVMEALYPLTGSSSTEQHSKDEANPSGRGNANTADNSDEEEEVQTRACSSAPKPSPPQLDAVERAMTIKSSSRDRLVESRHVWVVFFLLWCHTVLQRQLAVSSANTTHTGSTPATKRSGRAAGDDKNNNEEEEEALLMSALLTSAEAFLDQQQQQLSKVLEAVEALAN